MNWQDRLKNIQLIVITGDGKEYRPLWQNAVKNIKFNTEGFDFVGVEGTFVERKKGSGNQYPFVFYFQGDDKSETIYKWCRNFNRSKSDPASSVNVCAS